MLLTHVDGQTWLNIPGIHEQERLERQSVNIHIQSGGNTPLLAINAARAGRNSWKDGLSQLPRRMFSFLPTVSPSFHGVEEADTICWATDLDQIFPAHPQEVSTFNESRRKSAHRASFADSDFRSITGLLGPRDRLLIPNMKHSSLEVQRPCCYLRSWRRALRKARTCDGAATAERPAARTMAGGATCQKEEEPLK